MLWVVIFVGHMHPSSTPLAILTMYEKRVARFSISMDVALFQEIWGSGGQP